MHGDDYFASPLTEVPAGKGPAAEAGTTVAKSDACMTPTEYCRCARRYSCSCSGSTTGRGKFAEVVGTAEPWETPLPAVTLTMAPAEVRPAKSCWPLPANWGKAIHEIMATAAAADAPGRP